RAAVRRVPAAQLLRGDAEGDAGGRPHGRRHRMADLHPPGAAGGPPGHRQPGHLPVPVGVERHAGGAAVRGQLLAAPDGGTAVADPPVRQQHRRARAGGVPVPGRAGGRVLRVPAALRAGRHGGVREVARRRRGGEGDTLTAPSPLRTPGGPPTATPAGTATAAAATPPPRPAATGCGPGGGRRAPVPGSRPRPTGRWPRPPPCPHRRPAATPRGPPGSPAGSATPGSAGASARRAPPPPCAPSRGPRAAPG